MFKTIKSWLWPATSAAMLRKISDEAARRVSTPTLSW